MHPNLVEHLAVFVKVVDSGGLSAAARELNRAVSSVSYSLGQLESYCGFALLERSSRRIDLTPRGRALFAEAKSVIETARRFEAHAASLERGQETQIRIAVDVLFPSAPIHAALRRFAEKHARTRLQLFTTSLNRLWDDLNAAKLDFGVALMTSVPQGMEARSFGQLTFSPVAAVGHPLARMRKLLSVSDMQAFRQIYYVGFHTLDLERSGRVFSTDVWTSNDLEHIRLLIRNGLGWCFSTDQFFAQEIEAGLVAKLRCMDAQLNPSRTIGLVWPGDRRPGPLGRELMDMIAAEVAGLSDRKEPGLIL